MTWGCGSHREFPSGRVECLVVKLFVTLAVSAQWLELLACKMVMH